MSLEEKIGKIKIDCIHFRGGYMPCVPHREEGVHCDNCAHYQKEGEKILILKLGAAGEVIRNTPLLRRLRKEYPLSKIYWVTEYPELIPKDEVFKVYDFNQKTNELIMDIEFDYLFSLDKHEQIGALANQLKAKVKKGFSQKNGVIVPFDEDAFDKWERGIFDDVMKKNEEHYIEETFRVCGFKFEGEEYMLPEYPTPTVGLNKRKTVVALNTGAGDNWKPRFYPDKKWKNVVDLLLDRDYEVMLVGGPDEDQKNKEIARESGAKYFGVMPRKEFIGLMNLSDIVCTQVTFGLHVAIGLRKKVVLLNNVFNKNEFYLYGRGNILEPDLDCLMCYKNDFDDKCPVPNCMDLIKPETIVESIDLYRKK